MPCPPLQYASVLTFFYANIRVFYLLCCYYNS
nr:MAG TPA: hypothetical protein [Caudoviricetes sp.]